MVPKFILYIFMFKHRAGRTWWPSIPQYPIPLLINYAQPSRQVFFLLCTQHIFGKSLQLLFWLSNILIHCQIAFLATFIMELEYCMSFSYDLAALHFLLILSYLILVIDAEVNYYSYSFTGKPWNSWLAFSSFVLL